MRRVLGLLALALVAAQEPPAAPVIPPDFSIVPKPAAPAPAAETPDDAAAIRMLKAAQAAGLKGTVLYGSPEDSFTIVVGVAPGGTPIDKGQGVWRWASVTKQVVAVLALQEVEAGRLQLDEPIAGKVGDVAVPNADKVTLRMLLQHSSGLASDEDGAKDGEGRLKRYLASEPAAVGVPAECLAAPKAEPGAGFRYNNCDYLIAGAMIERSAGKSLAELFVERIAGPLGLKATRFATAGQPLSAAVGPDLVHRDDGFDEGRFGAAAGIVGPIEDLYAFDVGLMGGRLLGPASMAALWNGDPKLGYAALGAWVFEAKLEACAAPVRLVERRGEIGGVQVRNFIAPQLKRIVIAFSNHPIEYGEVWQRKGVSYDLLSAALCPEIR